MAVVHCKEITNRGADEDGDQFTGARVRTWQVITDNATDGAGVVLSTPTIALLYDAWISVNELDIITDIEPDLICIHRSAEQNDSNDLNNWLVTCRYAGADPISLPADVEVDQVDYQKSIIDDVITGEPVINKAGDPFEEGAVVDRSRGLIRISKNLAEWNAKEMEAYRDTLNASTMFTAQFPPGFTEAKLKMRSLTAKRIPYPGNQTFYWRATAVIETNLEGWQIKLRNQGRRCRTVIGGPPRRRPFLDGGLVSNTPFLLDPDGLELPAGGTPNTCDFNGYDLVDWTPLTWLDF